MVKPLPAGWHTITPRIVVRDAAKLVEFLKDVFGATGEFRPDRPSVMAIGDSLLMISSGGIRDVMPAFLYVYVENVDATYRRALEAGAASVETPAGLPYGDRRAMVKDRWGNLWQIASHEEDPPIDATGRH